MFTFFKRKKDIVLLKNSEFTEESAKELAEETGYTCLLVNDIDSVKIISRDSIKETANLIKAQIIKRHNDPAGEFVGEDKK